MPVITKQQAAEAQLNAAIRLALRGDNPIAVVSLASSAGQVLRDVGAKKAPLMLQLEEFLDPEKNSEFWGIWNSAWTYLKHAKNDKGIDSKDVEWDKLGDVLCYLYCELYFQIYGSQSAEMKFYDLYGKVEYGPKFLAGTGRENAMKPAQEAEAPSLTPRRLRIIAGIALHFADVSGWSTPSDEQIRTCLNQAKAELLKRMSQPASSGDAQGPVSAKTTTET